MNPCVCQAGGEVDRRRHCRRLTSFGNPLAAVLADDDGTTLAGPQVLRNEQDAPGEDVGPDVEHDFVAGPARACRRCGGCGHWGAAGAHRSGPALPHGSSAGTALRHRRSGRRKTSCAAARWTSLRWRVPASPCRGRTARALSRTTRISACTCFSMPRTCRFWRSSGLKPWRESPATPRAWEDSMAAQYGRRKLGRLLRSGAAGCAVFAVISRSGWKSRAGERLDAVEFAPTPNRRLACANRRAGW